jgi:ubiquinone/menaquinone biosynthesis C-methylase UbiE
MNDQKKMIQGVFDRAAQKYGRAGSLFFQYFGQRLVSLVPVSKTQYVLDVATGRGAVLFPAALAVGTSGKVIGIDISLEMLKETEREVQEKAFTWIHLQQMDAERLQFSHNSFDCIFCGFALFFFPSLSTALAECKRVLKPGGTFAVSIWGKKSDLFQWLSEEAKKLTSAGSLSVTPIFDSESLRKALKEASFESIQIIEEKKVFYYATGEEWWNSLWARGTRSLLEQLTPEQVIHLREKAIPKAEQLSQGEGIPEELQVFYGIAHKV